MKTLKRSLLAFSASCCLAATVAASPDLTGGHDHDQELDDGLGRPDPSAPLAERDAFTGNIISEGPFAKIIKNLAVTGRGERNVGDATTDVWAYEGYAYTGTFNSPCGGEEGAGIWVWDVHNKNRPQFVTIIESPVGSRSNDVKVATMNAGDILVHTNELCAGGPGGFEIYDVADPANPVHLASVQTDDVNLLLRDNLGFVDFGVHNLFLFTQDNKDYVAAVVESEFGNFQIFDITDPVNPILVGFWGAEQLHRPDVTDWVNLTDSDIILDADAYLFSGFGASQNRFLHDITVSADGNHAYLSNWDAGLVLLDISDPADPLVVSVAFDLSADGDMEVNSHAAWPSEDGSIVVETNEDFAPFETKFSIDTEPSADDYPAAEGAITMPISNLPGQLMSGPTTYVGFACNPETAPGFDDLVPTGSGIALIQRGACTFSEKINNAESAGYSGVVVFNDEARGDALVTMGGDPVNLPGVFVGHSTGLAIAGAGSAADLVIGAAGEEVSASAVPNGWGQVRIWDYSDPENPMLASSFDTVCSATVVDPSCDPNGTYSVHNVIVETTGNKVKAYISWYWDGMLVLDVTDPYNPVKIARYLDTTGPNDGMANDFWGVYKIPNQPWIYGSDRNGGLYVLKEFGAGSIGRK